MFYIYQGLLRLTTQEKINIFRVVSNIDTYRKVSLSLKVTRILLST